MRNNIVLIGFMGVGKGTIARAFAKEFDMFCIDTDDLIESMEKKRIKDIFEHEGEAYFRDKEKKCAKWLTKNVKGTIISTGGGFYKVKNLNKIGTVILLDSSFEAILQRIKSHPNADKKLAKRPLFNSLEEAKKLYLQRSVEYKKVSDIIINVENRSQKEIIKDLYKTLQN